MEKNINKTLDECKEIMFNIRGYLYEQIRELDKKTQQLKTGDNFDVQNKKDQHTKR